MESCERSRKIYPSYSKNTVHNNNEDNDSKLSIIKSHILDFLYNKIEVNEHKYTIIKNISDVYDLKSKKYYVSGNSCGINSFLIFMKKDGNYYSYIVDRRSISYNRQTLKKSSVRISEIKLSVDLKLYDGTIMDGIIIDNDVNIVSNKNNKNNKISFMVSDVFMFSGKSMITMDYKQKMYFVSLMMKKMLDTTNSINNTAEIIISRPYELNQIKDMFLEINSNLKNHNIKGITFYPQHSSNKLIYIFDKQDEQFKNNLLFGSSNIKYDSDINKDKDEIDSNTAVSGGTERRMILDKKIIFKFELINPECIDDIILNFEMIKTNIPDVYKLYSIFDKNKTFIKRKIGIAYIPTYILSITCKTYFLNTDSIIISCKFNTYKNKWIPIEEAKIKKIDIITNEKRLKIIEQEIYEQDIHENDPHFEDK